MNTNLKTINHTLNAVVSAAILAAFHPMAVHSQVMTAEQQQALTPDAVLSDLMDGNKRFAAGEVTLHKNVRDEISAAAAGQHPQAIILSCVDSRVPVEVVFDQNIGDVFVARVAGNVENVDILGSMEFATKAAGAKLVMVLGHEACGAVKGACDGVEMGNLTALLTRIQPAIDAVSKDAEGDRTSKNTEFVDRVIRQNVVQTVKDIRASSPILAELEKEGTIKIVGAHYDLDTGEVTLLETGGAWKLSQNYGCSRSLTVE